MSMSENVKRKFKVISIKWNTAWLDLKQNFMFNVVNYVFLNMMFYEYNV